VFFGLYRTHEAATRLKNEKIRLKMACPLADFLFLPFSIDKKVKICLLCGK
jgi:hypothetical protein